MKRLKHWSAALLAAPWVWVCGSAYATELVINGSFEQNNGAGTSGFVGWQSQSQTGSQGGFWAQKGTKSAITPVAVPAPPAGSFAAMSDQPGPGSHVLYQDIVLPVGQPIQFSAQVYVQNAARIAAAQPSLDYTADAPNQQVRIDVMNPTAGVYDVGAGVLQNLFSWPATGGAPAHAATSSTYANIQADLSALAGQTVRIRIAQVDNRQSLFAGVDALSVVQAAAPTTLLAPAGLTYLLQNSTAQLHFSPVAAPLADPITAYAAQCTPSGGGAVISATALASPIVVNGLAPAQAYSCTVTAQTTSTTGPASSPLHFVMPAAASNATVVPNLQGVAVPLVLANSAGGATTCTVQSAQFVHASTLIPLPPQGASAYPFGVVALKLDNCALGEQVQLSMTMPSAIPTGATYWKYGPTPANAVAHWYPFSGFSASGNVMTLTLKDGAEGDDDLQENGQIADPGGIAVVSSGSVSGTARPVPVWSWQGWLVLSLILASWGWTLRRRRPH